jgi:metal transporter CNNM
MAISANRSLAIRPIALGLGKLFMLSLSHLSFVSAAPASHFLSRRGHTEAEPQPLPADDASLWLYLGVAAALVLTGGAFAGLTIALMGQVCASDLACFSPWNSALILILSITTG